MSGEQPTVPRAEAAAASETTSASTTPQAEAKPARRRFGLRPENSRTVPTGEVKLPSGEVLTGSTNQPVEFATLWSNRKQRGVETEVRVDSESAKQCYDFLHKYVTRLGSSADLATIYNDPNRLTDKILLDKLTTRIDATGEMVADPQKIVEHLQSPKGISTTLMLLEEEALLIEMTMGVDATLNRQFSRSQKTQKRSGKTVVDSQLTLPNIAKFGLEKSVLGLVGLGYLTVGTGKSKLEFTNNDELLQSVLASTTPEQRAYIRARVGLDLDAINPDGTYKDYYNPDLDSLKARATEALSIRKNVLEGYGFDKPDRLGGKIKRGRQVGIPEEFIFAEDQMPPLILGALPDREGASPEDLPVTYVMEIMHEYGRLIAPVPGTPDKFTRLSMMVEARRIVMTHYLQKDLAERSAKAEHVRGDKDLKSLKEKRDLMKDKPEKYREEQKTEHEKKKNKAEEKKTELEKKKKELTEDPESAKQKEIVVHELERELTSSEFGVELTDDIGSAIDKRLADLAAEISGAKTPLTGAINDKLTAITDAEDRIRTTWEAGMVNLAAAKTVSNVPDLGAGLTTTITSLENAHNSLIAPLQHEYDELVTKRNNLIAKRDAYTRALREQQTAVSQITVTEKNQLQTAQDAINRFIVAGVGGGAPLLADSAAVRAKSVEELKNLLPATPALSDDEKMDIALRAKAQAEVDQTAQIPQYQKDALAILSGLTTPLTPDGVLETSQSELFIILRNHHAAAGVADSEERARKEAAAAYQGASKSLRVLAEARVTQELAYYEGVIKTEKKELETLGDFNEKKIDVDTAITVLDNAGFIGEDNPLSRVYEMADNPTQVALLTNTTPITATENGFSPAEAALLEERRVYEWYRLLAPDYTRDPEKRDDIFKALARILPPAELKTFLAAHPGTSGPDLQRAAQELIRYVRDKALTL